MRIRPLHMVLVAVIAPACLCAAQDGPHFNSQAKPEDLLKDVLQVFTGDSYVIVSPGRVIVRSGASIVQDGQSVPSRELVCEGRTAVLYDRAAATQDLYPMPEGFCDLLRAALPPANTGRQ